MAPRKSTRKARSKSCGRLPSEESPKATSLSANNNLQGTRCLSPQSDTPLPPKQTTVNNGSVSTNTLPQDNEKNYENSEFQNSSTKMARQGENSNISHDSQSVFGEMSQSNQASPNDLSDNREVQNISKEKADSIPPSKQEEPWHVVYQELRAIKERVASLEKIEKKIEKSTDLHTQQLSGVVQRTAALETSMGSAESKINTLNIEVTTLREVVDSQTRIIAELQQKRDDMVTTNAKTVADMDKLIKKQQRQVDGFHECTATFKKDLMVEVINKITETKDEINNATAGRMGEMDNKITKMTGEVDGLREYTATVKRDVMEDVDGKIDKVKDEVQYISLKSKANSNRDNLVITGLKEDPQKTDMKLVSSFFKDCLKIPNVDIDVVYRMGEPAREGHIYTRPLVVRFPRASEKKKVWAGKTDITEEDGNIIRIQADLPKRLRDDAVLLNRVVKAAGKIPKYKSAKIKDYTLLLHGDTYSPDDLERLPPPLRPSTLATPRSATAVAFFSKDSELSNHYRSNFTIEDHLFHSMEHYLAFKKAQLTGQQATINKALKVKDPVEAKAVLNSLKNSVGKEWKKQAPAFAEAGLRAKFRQNQYLLEFLLETGDRQLGEASRDTFWGVGATLTHPQILDTSNWPPEGNLLGRSLMKIRDELRAPTSTPQNSPRKSRKK